MKEPSSCLGEWNLTNVLLVFQISKCLIEWQMFLFFLVWICFCVLYHKFYLTYNISDWRMQSEKEITLHSNPPPPPNLNFNNSCPRKKLVLKQRSWVMVNLLPIKTGSWSIKWVTALHQTIKKIFPEEKFQ